MIDQPLSLDLLPETYAITQAAPDSQAPQGWDKYSGSLLAILYTPEELTWIAPETAIISNYNNIESDWRAFKVRGPLPFEMIGVLSTLTTHLASAAISVFVLSTFNTDYILIKQDNLCRALVTLEKAGYTIYTNETKD